MIENKKILFVLFILLIVLSACSSEEKLGSEMILISAGTTSKENASITLSSDIYIGKYEVTQAQFEEIMGFNPSNNTGINKPVEQVTWFDAIMYCNKLSEKEGYEKKYVIRDIEKNDLGNIISAEVKEKRNAIAYRLPTKNEWEYAARGGSDGEATLFSGSNDIDEVAWCYSASEQWKSKRSSFYRIETKTVGEKKANELGIYDMTGNVSEWTNSSPARVNYVSDIDTYVLFGNDEKIIEKGGSCYTPEAFASIDKSVNNEPSEYDETLGFRLVRSK